MDRELRLLVLMQRQIEQARSLGIDGPRLEYLDEPPELRVRVADVGSVEEAHLLGRPRGYESEEEAGGLLKRLYDQGYVKLTLMNGERASSRSPPGAWRGSGGAGLTRPICPVV